MIDVLELNRSIHGLELPVMLSTTDHVYAVFGFPGLILYYGIEGGLIVILIWLRIQVYKTEKKERTD